MLQRQCQHQLSAPSKALTPLQLHIRLLTSRSHPTVNKVVRVNHAGEFGANKIYAGQAAVLGKTDMGELIQVGNLHAVFFTR